MSAEQFDGNPNNWSTQTTPGWMLNFADPPMNSFPPPGDPDEPGFPYVAGFAVQIHRDVPPSPRVKRSDLHDTAELTITEPIKIGDGRGSQVVACRVFPHEMSGTSQGGFFEAVARICDPLYYGSMSDTDRNLQEGAFKADEDYNKEATVYNYLSANGRGGRYTPIYHGSWTFSLPTTIKGRRGTRNVRLILTERLYGTTLIDTRQPTIRDECQSMDSFDLPEEYRLEVLAQAMEGYLWLLRSGVQHIDFSMRNIMLVTPSSDDCSTPAVMVRGIEMPSVVLIDFKAASIIDASLHAAGNLPGNATSVFWNRPLWHYFDGWVPREWNDIEFQREWLSKRFGGRWEAR